ncbi:myosin II heavy chain [Bacillus phage vB_BanS_Nate]|uniref:Myosin II heavy chain n=1 Tax=Bacillus phage vB_BanS_Nate TaxID=2894788 RepID=A0AAE8YUZ9_9CAUD|nr:myosin II heavy chain [Bacillus phage vB_BanS_Nate]UGO51082.1 myosin II heavy chain [Bacillus phage vB_BanS_Nate]
MGKRLDFQASISDVKQVHPLFSTCKVRTLYTGQNRNMSNITKESVERALPTIYNIPIVGEFSMEAKDYKGHGGKIDLDTYKYVHTTKPYGVVPESATFSWEEVQGADGITREYLVINGCYLWTGRYEEAYSIVDKGKGQSMEIEVTRGEWVDEDESYRIDDFIFSGLCILGDEVEPAFEDANITAYSFEDKDSFKNEFAQMKEEFAQMMSELKDSLNKNKEVIDLTLEQLLEKYSVSANELAEAGITIEGLEGDSLETVLSDFAKKKKEDEEKEKKPEDNKDGEKKPADDKDKQPESKPEDDKEKAPADDKKPSDEEDEEKKKKAKKEKGKFSNEEDQADYDALLASYNAIVSENSQLKAFKKAVEEAEHENKVADAISELGLTDEDEGVTEIKESAHEFTLDQVKEKCYGILGRKAFAKKQNFSSKKDNQNIKLPLGNKDDNEETPKQYGGLFEKYNK